MNAGDEFLNVVLTHGLGRKQNTYIRHIYAGQLFSRSQQLGLVNTILVRVGAEWPGFQLTKKQRDSLNPYMSDGF